MAYKYDVGRYKITGQEIERVKSITGFAWIAFSLREPNNGYIGIEEMYAANSSGAKLPDGEMHYSFIDDEEVRLAQTFINAPFKISVAMIDKVSKNLHKEIDYMDLKPTKYKIPGQGNIHDYVGFRVKTKHR